MTYSTTKRMQQAALRAREEQEQLLKRRAEVEKMRSREATEKPIPAASSPARRKKAPKGRRP